MLNHYTYTYDGYGNITAIEGTETASEGIDKLTGAKMTYGADNRLLTYNGEELQYDAEGNMTYGPVNGVMSTLTYDCRNRLVSAGGITYTYDAENNRISAETDTYLEEYVTDTVSSSLSRVLTATRYEKQKDASGKETLDAGSTTTYYYGTGLISETKGHITLYHHYNHLGSTTKLTDSDGNVVETYTYGTYGELLSGDATLTRFLYNGEMGVSTDDNGLFYMRQRYYNPEIKRFVNQDFLSGTLDNSQSLNRYCYVQGNPVSYVDPFGLSPLSTPEGRHTIFGLLGCIPVIGIVFNGIDAYYYFKEGDIGMGLWSIVAMVSDGAALAGKAAMGTANVFKAANQGAKAQKYARMAVTAQKIHHGAELVSNGVNFLKNGSMALENAGDIYTKLKNGEKVGFGEWMELGANVLGMGMSAGFGYKNAQGLKAARQTDITGLLKGAVAEGACFVAGTRIKTEDGSKSIEEIEVGDYVYARNTETGESGFKKVVHLFVKETEELIHLQIGDTRIETTPTHPFWVGGYGFKPAGELKAGDYVLSAEGELLHIDSVYRETPDEPVTVYNFEVEDWHTYYVSDAEVLVHNMCMLTKGKSG
ncbi:MAG: hypothetical protein IKL04_06820, partial [Lachnospiraceae bacterium]|nr:hypothetical protein [Lachnospiraceae bacterium]